MIDILMAVYNGGEFLGQQIESIIAQTFTDWRLIIADDCSSDSSFDIACGYARQYPDKIYAFRNETPTGSAKANFMQLTARAEAEYIMFSDQDDFWLPHKLERTMSKMHELEQSCGDIPLLVHTELEIVGSALEHIHDSFTRFQGLSPAAASIERLAVQNNVTGCTTMINRKLLELVKDADPQHMLMHDWWIAMAAAAFGRIGFVSEPTIKYRQHGGNQVGAVNNRSIRGALRIIRDRMKTKKRVSLTYTQAEHFYSCYRDILSDRERKMLELYIDIPKHKKLVRAFMLLRYGFLKQNILTAAGQLVFC